MPYFKYNRAKTLKNKNKISALY